MKHSEKVRLHFGPYQSPPVEVGQEVTCAIRGLVTVKGFSSGHIRWPWCQAASRKVLVVFGDLEKAIRNESNLAICYWWGVSHATVAVWRKGLGVPPFNPGTITLRRAGYDDPARGKKISMAKKGVKRGPQSEATRRKIREALRRRWGGESK